MLIYSCTKTGAQKASAWQCRSWGGIRVNGLEQSFSSEPNDRVRLDLDQPPQPAGFHDACDGSAQEIGQNFPTDQ